MAHAWADLVEGPIDTAAVLARVADTAAGATVLFVGTTRGITAGRVTRGLEYEAHEPLAAAGLRELAAEATRAFGLTACAVVHRLGAVPVAAASVAIATSAPHRHEAFAAAEWLMERIKREVPIWKCEEAADGTRTWVHPEASPAQPVPEPGR
ncbi:MAG: molybdenum cofactor biosynthesis protein MoaE [Planctomycetia bacterium]|nr:molybdenum cofactor biosynthesis protein MoaE [Planctomycetia bacterium]